MDKLSDFFRIPDNRNRKRGRSAPRDASLVHERRARGSEMNLDGLDTLGAVSPPRQSHRMLTRCARPPFRFHPQRVGTSSDPALARVAGDTTR